MIVKALAHLLADGVNISSGDFVWSGHICKSVKDKCTAKNTLPHAK